MKKAFWHFDVKSFDDDKRTFEGIASTPSVDRMGDIVEPAGAKFVLPLTLMWQHGRADIDHPVGWIREVRIAKSAIHVKGEFANLSEPPTLKEALDKAWALVKSKLVRGLSIGFRPIESEPIKNSDGWRYTSWEWLELSPVAVAANQDSMLTTFKSMQDIENAFRSKSILSVKSADSQALAALGRERTVLRLDKNLPGVTGPTVSKGKTMAKTIQQQIDDWQQKKAAAQTRMDAIMEKSGEESRELAPDESEEYDGLESEVSSIDKHLERLKKHESSLVARATKITSENTDNGEKAASARGGVVLSVRSNVPKGTAFVRAVMAIAATKGQRQDAIEWSKRWKDSTPEVELFLKANSDIGTTTDADWAAPLLANAQNVTGEFIDLLRPATIVGRIQGLRKVPFNVRVPSQTGGGTYGWVGQGAAKPVGQLAFSDVSLLFAKVAGILVISEELARFSSPSAEALIRNDMVEGTARFIDTQFVDPAVAAVANVSPASVTNGAPTAAATGVTAAAFRTDMAARIAQYTAANDDLSSVVVLMPPGVAMNLSLLLNPLGQSEFPGIGLSGGSIFGLPVIVSGNVGARIILVKASDILLADDGGVTIDVSREASVEMSTAPSNSPQATEMVSLWQRNLVGLRVDRFITWAKSRTTSVTYVSNAVYSG